MMTSTAAVQVNLDGGADAVDVARRWSLLARGRAALVAAFANSPMRLGRDHRVEVHPAAGAWRRWTPTRRSAPRGPDPVTAWAEYALGAPVMMCRRPGDWLASPGFTFRDWVAGVAGFAPPRRTISPIT